LGLIFNEHGEVLMTIRAIAPERGKLDLPGGFLRAGELPADGVKRELREELGVDVLPGASVGYAIDRYYDQGRYEYILSVAFTVRIVRGEPTVADRREIAGLKWVDPSRVEAASLAFAGNETFLAMCRDGHIVRT
jgi:NAD+ diphosphatase